MKQACVFRTRSVLAVGSALALFITVAEVLNLHNLHEINLSYQRQEGQALLVEGRLTQLIVDQELQLKGLVRRFGGDDNALGEVSSVALEQARRRRVMQQVCAKYKKLRTVDSYSSTNDRFDQTVRSNFLLDERSRSVYCFNHKAASSTWMAVFASLYHDKGFFEALVESGHYYKIEYKMGSRSRTDLLRKTSSGDYFTFMVVRHPFDRVLSAFRDRMTDGCTDQAKQHIPRIFHALGLGNRSEIFSTNGCAKLYPTFAQFLQYLILKPNQHDVHWMSYAENCAPCVLNYDAVIKLETSEQDQEYVMRQSTMEKYTSLEYRHRTSGGKTEFAREEYYSQVPCHVLHQLYAVYAMDFELFEYGIAPFDQYCTY